MKKPDPTLNQCPDCGAGAAVLVTAGQSAKGLFVVGCTKCPTSILGEKNEEDGRRKWNATT